MGQNIKIEGFGGISEVSGPSTTSSLALLIGEPAHKKFMRKSPWDLNEISNQTVTIQF